MSAAPHCPLHNVPLALIHTGPPRAEDLQSFPDLAAIPATEVLKCPSCSIELIRSQTTHQP